MNSKSFALWLAVAVGLPALATAAEPQAQRETDLDARIEAAEQRLQQAAEELAQLNLELNGGELDHVVRVVRGTAPPRAMLGINIAHVRTFDGDTSTKLGETDTGVEVAGVTPGGPADTAGIRAGDIIVALNGTRLDGAEVPAHRRLPELMRTVEPGDSVELLYLRDGEQHRVDVVTQHFAHRFDMDKSLARLRDHVEMALPGTIDRFVDHLPALTGFMHEQRWGEIELVTLNPALGRYFGTDKGLLVVRAPAEKLPLQAGDVILAIGGATPDTVPDAMRLLRFYEPGDKLVLEIMRDKRGKTLEISVPEQAS